MSTSISAYRFLDTFSMIIPAEYFTRMFYENIGIESKEIISIQFHKLWVIIKLIGGKTQKKVVTKRVIRKIQLATSVSVRTRRKGETNCWNLFKMLVLYVTYCVCLITVCLIVIHYFKREWITEEGDKRIERKRQKEELREKEMRRKRERKKEMITLKSWFKTCKNSYSSLSAHCFFSHFLFKDFFFPSFSFTLFPFLLHSPFPCCFMILC